MKKGPEGPLTTRLSRRAGVYEVGVFMVWILRAQVRAQMSAYRPEADSEYSRARPVRRGLPDDSRARWQRRFRGLVTIARAPLGDLPADSPACLRVSVRR